VLPQFDVVLTEVDEPGPLHEHHPLHQALAATRRRGTLVPLGAPAPEDAAAKRVRVLPTPPAPTAADLRRAVDALAAGLVDPLPPRVFPVADRTAAHAALAADGERRGAVVLAWA
jgi:NADPH:quinone reductase-like Zn-dependent oxidoreductase